MLILIQHQPIGLVTCLAGHLFSNWSKQTGITYSNAHTCHTDITLHQQCSQVLQAFKCGMQASLSCGLLSYEICSCTLGRLGRVGGLAVGPLGRPAASPGFTLLGRSSLDTPDPGRSKASSPTFMNPRGLFLIALSAAPFKSGVLPPALLLALLAASETCKIWHRLKHLLL